MFKIQLVSVCMAVATSACITDIDPSEPTETTEQAVIWQCTGQDAWYRRWLVNGAEVGREDCTCGSTEVIRHGTIAGTYVQQWLYSCGGSPPPNPGCESIAAPRGPRSFAQIIYPPPPPPPCS